MTVTDVQKDADKHINKSISVRGQLTAPARLGEADAITLVKTTYKLVFGTDELTVNSDRSLEATAFGFAPDRIRLTTRRIVTKASAPMPPYQEPVDTRSFNENEHLRQTLENSKRYYSENSLRQIQRLLLVNFELVTEDDSIALKLSQTGAKDEESIEY